MTTWYTYFCSKNVPIADEIDGAKFITPQWVFVDFSKSNMTDHITQKASPNMFNFIVTPTKVSIVNGKAYLVLFLSFKLLSLGEEYMFIIYDFGKTKLRSECVNFFKNISLICKLT